MRIDRRAVVLGGLTAGVSGFFVSSAQSGTELAKPATRAIPSSGERLPLVGLGSWITFNVGSDPKLLDECAAVIAAFFEGGGRLIDTSPMYGSAQATIGYGLQKLGYPKTAFSAEKVWTSSQTGGPRQIEESLAHWGVPSHDLIQVHNLVAWKTHLEMLREMKSAGRLRYVGITTSHGRRHAELEQIMSSEPIDFVQVTYNAIDREVEDRILPLARERGIAVIINRPFQRGDLLRRVEGKPLPPWLKETGATSWAQFLLAFVISHPAVTCAIPATTRVEHVRENLGVAARPLPDERLRMKMAAYVNEL